MAKIKVLYIITQSEWGGAQRYVYDLATNLKDGFEPVVLCGGSGELLHRLKERGITVFQAEYLRREINPIIDWLALREVKGLIRLIRPDLIHTNSSKAEILGNWAASSCRVPVVFTAHGFVFNEPMNKLKRWAVIMLERFANRKSQAIICVSDFDRCSALQCRIGRKAKLLTIHNGIKIMQNANFKSQNEKLKVKNKEKIIVGTIANLYKNKGIEYLVEAAKSISQNPPTGGPNLEFWVIGEGEERKVLEEKIAATGLDNFKLLGFKENATELLGQFDLFVLPSVKEGFPYTILEAMGEGLPIVATSVGGIPEAVEDGKNGFLVVPANPVALATKIQFLLSNPVAKAAFSRNCLEKVKKDFSLEKMVEQTAAVYKDILGLS